MWAQWGLFVLLTGNPASYLVCLFLTLFIFFLPPPLAWIPGDSSQFDPAPRDENWHKSPRTPDYFL